MVGMVKLNPKGGVDLTGIGKEIKAMFEEYKKENSKSLEILVKNQASKPVAATPQNVNAAASKEFYAKHAALQKEVTAVDNKFKTISASIAALSKELDEMKKNNPTMGDIAAVKKLVSNLQTSLSALDKRVDSLDK